MALVLIQPGRRRRAGTESQLGCLSASKQVVFLRETPDTAVAVTREGGGDVGANLFHQDHRDFSSSVFKLILLLTFQTQPARVEVGEAACAKPLLQMLL